MDPARQGPRIPRRRRLSPVDIPDRRSRESPRLRARLLRSVERAKCALSSQPYVRLEEEFVAEKDRRALHLSVELSRNDYEEMIRPLVDKSLASVQTAIQDAGLSARDLDTMSEGEFWCLMTRNLGRAEEMLGY